MIHRKPRFYYIITFLLLLVTELAIALYINDSFVRPYLGDLLATIVVYCGFMSITNIRVRTVILISLLFSYLIESLQWFQIVEQLGLMENQTARIMIGTSFSWMDVFMYSLGAAVIYLIEKFTPKSYYK